MKRRGSQKGRKVRGNTDARTLSPQIKTVKSVEMLEHMGLLLRLIQDAAATQRHHVSKLRKELGLPPNVALPDEIGDHDGRPKDYFTTVQQVDGDTDKDRARKEAACGLLLEDGCVIVGLRIYRTQAGEKDDDQWLVKSIPVEHGKEWVAHNQRLIEERATYSEMNRKVVTAGAVIGNRKGKDTDKRKQKVRIATSPLKTIACRLMPHEARILVGDLTQDGLARAMDSVKRDIEREVGCEVLSIAAHRMRNNDLHIHIQYTMVKEVEMDKIGYGRIFRPWERMVTEAAEKSLIADGKRVAPATVGKRKKLLEAEGKVPPRPSRFRLEKQKGLRNLHNKTCQLGYSFKFKLNLLRAAQAFPEEHEIAEKIASRGDRKGDFAAKVLSKTDEELQAEKIDYWLERRWREAVAAEVPEETRALLPAAGLEEARKYAIHGTTQVEPVHYERHRETIKEQLADSEKQLNKTLEEAAALEKRIADMAADLQAQETRLRDKRSGTADAIRAARKEKRQLERSRARTAERIRSFRTEKRVASEALDQRTAEVNKKESGLPALERSAELQGVQAAFGALFPDRKPVSDTVAEIVGEIKTGIDTVRNNAVATAKAEVAQRLDEIREMTEPVPVTAVAAKLRFAPEESGEDGVLTREVKALQPDKPSFWQRLVTTGQNFVLSILGNDNVSPRKGSGAIQLIQTVNPKASLDEIVGKLVEWFPKKRHAIMTELVDRHGSDLMRSLIRGKAGPNKPEGGPSGPTEG